MAPGRRVIRSRVAIAVLVAVALGGPAQAADRGGNAGSAQVDAGGGLQGLTVEVDPARRVVRFTVGKTAGETPIELAPDELGAAGATVEAVAIGGGKRVVHVRVPSGTRADVAWEAILAGRSPAVLWSGVTGYASGEAGELAGEGLELPERNDAGDRAVVVGEVREDLRICGQARTLLSPRALDPETLSFRGATMQRLPGEQRDGAERVVASPHGGPADAPLARLLLATGASSAIGAPSALTDGDPATTWSEGRPSDGHGEFVTMRAPAEVPIARIALTIAPPAPSARGAAPRTLFLVTDDRTISVTLPEDAWAHPGAAYDVPLADPIRASCLTLVLDKAYEHGRDPHPEVTIAEVTAYSVFDVEGATLEKVAKALDGGGARSEAAKGVIERAGDAGLAAASAAYGGLDAAGRALAIDAAIGAGTCEAAAPLLLAAMEDKDREVARKGREKIERCGKRAAAALLAALRAPDEAGRAGAAEIAAALAPSEALDALVADLGQGAPATRKAVRRGVARAARAASAETLAALVRQQRPAEARIDLLRALADELPGMRADADAAIDALGAGSPPMRSRYLLVEPIGVLARAGDRADVARLEAAVASDPDAAVRAHAAESAAGVSELAPSLAHAVASDDSPRVREAALVAFAALAGTKSSPALEPIAERLAKDEWTFVRAAAAAALAAFPADTRADAALEKALGDRAPGVRETAIGALAAHGDASAAAAIRARLADEHETLEVRLAAVKALAALCDRASLDLLTTLARRAPLPMATDDELLVGGAATDALGRLHPADLSARLAPFAAKDASPEARAAAARALAMTPGCR